MPNLPWGGDEKFTKYKIYKMIPQDSPNPLISGSLGETSLGSVYRLNLNRIQSRSLTDEGRVEI